MRPYRAWINQPSTTQPLHALHGKRCIAVKHIPDDGMVDVYFTEGSLHSMRVPKRSISQIKLSSAEDR